MSPKFIRGFRIFDNSMNEIKNLELILKIPASSKSSENADIPKFVKMNSFIRERINPNYKEHVQEEEIEYLGELFPVEERENYNGESFGDYILPFKEFHPNANSIILENYNIKSDKKEDSDKEKYPNKFRNARYAFISHLRESR